MHFPTIYNTKDNLVHIVKDKQICECGFAYNYFSTFSKLDFKKIKFKHVQEITCPNCIDLFLYS
jgi:hypothetical protein